MRSSPYFGYPRTDFFAPICVGEDPTSLRRLLVTTRGLPQFCKCKKTGHLLDKVSPSMRTTGLFTQSGEGTSGALLSLLSVSRSAPIVLMSHGSSPATRTCSSSSGTGP